jgi:hypothetical protein
MLSQLMLFLDQSQWEFYQEFHKHCSLESRVSEVEEENTNACLYMKIITLVLPRSHTSYFKI